MPGIEVAEVVVAAPIVGNHSSDLAEAGLGVRDFAGCFVGAGDAADCGRIARVDLQRLIEFLQGEIVLALLIVDRRQRGIGGRQTSVELLRPLTFGDRHVEPLRIALDLVLHPIGFAELRIAESEERIGFDRVLQGLDRAVEVTRLVVALHQAKRGDVALVSGRLAVAAGHRHHAREGHGQPLANAGDEERNDQKDQQLHQS